MFYRNNRACKILIIYFLYKQLVLQLYSEVEMARARSAYGGQHIAKDCRCRPTVQGRAKSRSSPVRVGGCVRKDLREIATSWEDVPGGWRHEYNGMGVSRTQLCWPQVAWCRSEFLVVADVLLDFGLFISFASSLFKTWVLFSISSSLSINKLGQLLSLP